MDVKGLDAYGWMDGRGLDAYGWMDGWHFYECIWVDGWMVDVWMHMDGWIDDRFLFRFELPSPHVVLSISDSNLPCMVLSNHSHGCRQCLSDCCKYFEHRLGAWLNNAVRRVGWGLPRSISHRC